MTITSPPSNPRSIFVFTSPRTTSNMFIKIFSSHSALKVIDYPLMYAAIAGPEMNVIPWSKPVSVDNNNDKTSVEPESETKASSGKKPYADLTFAKAWKTFLDTCETAEKEGKFPFIKEHCVTLINPQLDYTSAERRAMSPPILNYPFGSVNPPEEPTTLPINPTILPTSFLLKLTPIFLIHHPARVVPSFLRATSHMGAKTTDVNFECCCSYRWPRLIYDWYRARYYGAGDAQGKRWPIVIDGDDLINNTSVVINELCAMFEINPKEAVFEWESVDITTQPKNMTSFLGTLMASSGIVKDEKLTKPLTIEEAAISWEKIYGAEDAKNMARIARDAMEDYEYLRKFRLGAMV